MKVILSFAVAVVIGVICAVNSGCFPDDIKKNMPDKNVPDAAVTTDVTDAHEPSDASVTPDSRDATDSGE